MDCLCRYHHQISINDMGTEVYLALAFQYAGDTHFLPSGCNQVPFDKGNLFVLSEASRQKCADSASADDTDAIRDVRHTVSILHRFALVISTLLRFSLVSHFSIIALTRCTIVKHFHESLGRGINEPLTCGLPVSLVSVHQRVVSLALQK